MLVIKRKLYSKSFRSSLRIKRFSKISEEERLYALPFRIPRVRMPAMNIRPKINNMTRGISTRFNKIGTGIQAGWIKGTSKVRNIFNFGGKMGAQSNLTNKNLNINPNFTSLMGSEKGISTIVPSTPTPPSVMSSKVVTSSPTSMGGNKTWTVPRSTNPARYNTGGTGTIVRGTEATQFTNNQVGINKNIGFQTNENLSRTTGTTYASKGYDIGKKGSTIKESMQMKKAEDLARTQQHNQQAAKYKEMSFDKGLGFDSTYKAPGSTVENTISFNDASKVKPTQPVNKQSQQKPVQEKPFEIVGLAENQPKPSSTPTTSSTTNKEVKIETPSNTGTKTNTSVDNNNPVSQTTSNPTTEPATTPEQPKPEGAAGGGTNEKAPETGKTDAKTGEDKKFRLGWKGKLALGTAALGATAYGGAKLVGNMLKDEDEK